MPRFPSPEPYPLAESRHHSSCKTTQVSPYSRTRDTHSFSCVEGVADAHCLAASLPSRGAVSAERVAFVANMCTLAHGSLIPEAHLRVCKTDQRQTRLCAYSGTRSLYEVYQIDDIAHL